MQGDFNVIPLGGLAQLFDDQDKRSVYLVDTVGNSYTFFKYKAKLIDVLALYIAVGIGQKTKEDAIEQIRKGIAFGMNSGQMVIFHVGSKQDEIDDFMKGAKFWDPKQLFKPSDKMSVDWFKNNVMKPTDKDIFGNEGTLYPNEKYRIFVSSSQEVKFSDIKWLKGTENMFVNYQIK